MTNCPRLGKWFGGCRFEARFDSGEPAMGFMDRIESLTGPAGGLARAIEATKPKTYVHDICVHCGQTINRGDRK